jgi:multidrug transporter EmrE-like cation transporter
MKKIKQFLYWAKMKPIRKSLVSGMLFVPTFLIMRLIIDTKNFIKDIPNELTWAIAFGIGIVVIVLVHPLLFPDKYKTLDENKKNGEN